MKEKFKKVLDKMQPHALYYKTFFIGVIFMIALYILLSISPFGKYSTLRVDFYHQYGPMLAEYYDRVHNISNFIYSFNVGLGLPFYRNFLNYLSSPFNIIMFFFRRTDLVTSYGFVIALKGICAAVAMVFYLSHKFKTKDNKLIALGLLYAFSAYYSAYYWNIMWIDGMVFLPIITSGIERIINENKWKLYTISLAIMLVANYFMGYMICIFSVVYFIFYLILKTHISFKKGNVIKSFKEAFAFMFKKCCIFGTCSLIAGLICSVFLIPMFLSLKSISATGGSIPTTQYYDFKIIDFLKGHLTAAKVTIFASDTITNPNISAGILSVALLLAFIVNAKISLKHKICYGLILGFFIAAFFVPQLDYVLHAFHVPNDLPYRYSFIYTFILMIIAAYGMMNIKNLKLPIVISGYALLMAILFAISEDNWADLDKNMIYINMILLTLYFMFYISLKYLHNKWNIFSYGLILVVFIELLISSTGNWKATQVLDGFYEDYKSTEKLLDTIRKQDDEKFYRIENTNMMTLNDGAWYNYYGVNTFSSMAYESLAKLQHSLGMPGNQINSYFYVQSTPIYDIMFDIKYFIGQRNDYTRYEETFIGDENANKNLYNVGLAFGANRNLNEWDYESSNPFHIQQDFIEKSTGVKDVLFEPPLKKKEELFNDGNRTVYKYYFKNNKDNSYYYANEYSIDFVVIGGCVYYNNDNYDEVLSQIEGLEYSYAEDYDEEKVINIYSADDYIEVIVGYNNYYTKGFELYQIDHNALNEAYVKLYSNRLNITDFKESTIKGNIYLEENQLVYTSIPYDEGWHVYVDGKEVETRKLGDALLVFDCEAGNHDIKLTYKIPYFKLGASLSGLTILGLVIEHYKGEKIKNTTLNFLDKRKQKRLEKKKNKKVSK